MYHNPKPKVCSQKPLFLLLMETSCAQTTVGIFPVFLESAGVRAGTLPSLLQQRGASIAPGTAFCPVATHRGAPGSLPRAADPHYLR